MNDKDTTPITPEDDEDVEWVPILDWTGLKACGVIAGFAVFFWILTDILT